MSRWLALILAVTLIGATVLPLTVPLPSAVRWFAIVALGALAYRIYHAHFGANRIVRLVWDELGQWRLWLTDGSEWDVHLEGDSFVSPEVMILNFSSGQRRFHWVVLSDVLDGDTRRRLRVRLRLDRLNTDPAGDLANSGK